jgi:tetratricopeptide (TPR) repeat protein
MKIRALPAMALAVSWMLCGVAFGQVQVDCKAADGTATATRSLDEVKRLRTQGRLQAAARAVQPILASEPDSLRALYNSGLVQADLGELDQAERSLSQAAVLQEKCEATPGFRGDYTIYNSLGWLQLRRGKYRAAEASFKKALARASKLSPESLRKVQFNLGNLYFTGGDFEKAAPLLRQSEQLGSANAKRALHALNEAQAFYKEVPASATK